MLGRDTFRISIILMVFGGGVNETKQTMNLLNVYTIHKNKPLRLSRSERFMIFSFA